MGSTVLDLDAYCARIGYTGPREPTLDVLRALHRQHPEAIAFENLDPLARRPVDIDLDTLQRKLVAGGRGGWCFEQNLLLMAVLASFGFDVTGLAARVVWNAPAGTKTPRSHMLLRVEIDGATWIADVGFGGLTLTAPLRLQADTVQSTPHEPARLVQADTAWELQCRLGDAWKPMYRFDLQPQFHADYEVSNWYLAHHPRSRFVNGLMAARPRPGLRYALLDHAFSVYHADGRIERRRLGTADEIRAVLAQEFGVRVPDDPAIDAALQRIADQP